MTSLRRLDHRPEERRRHQRVAVVLLGRYMLADRQEYPCQSMDMSPGGLALVAPVLGQIGERVVCYLEQIGRVEGTIARYSEAFQAGLHRLREIPLVTAIARRYRGEVPLAVASNGTRVNVAQTLEAVGLSSLFDALVAVDDVAHGKPAPDLYLEAARRLGVKPEGCIVFEDTEPGIEAARAAGMRVRDIRTFLPHGGG